MKKEGRKTPGGHRQKGYRHFTLSPTVQLSPPDLFSPCLSHVQDSHTARGGGNPTAAWQLDSCRHTCTRTAPASGLSVSSYLAPLLEKSQSEASPLTSWLFCQHNGSSGHPLPTPPPATPEHPEATRQQVSPACKQKATRAL